MRDPDSVVEGQRKEAIADLNLLSDCVIGTLDGSPRHIKELLELWMVLFGSLAD